VERDGVSGSRGPFLDARRRSRQTPSTDPDKGIAFPWSFTPDGKRLAYIELDPGTAYELWTVPLDSDGTGLRAGKPEAILQNPAIDQGQRDEDAIQPN
jgi:hypothetical protein